MSPTKLSASLVLLVGLLTAPLFAEETPAKPAATYTFIDSADPAVAELAQFGFKAIEAIGGKLIQETTRELATKSVNLLLEFVRVGITPAGRRLRANQATQGFEPLRFGQSGIR